jgi:hypothetical protein
MKMAKVSKLPAERLVDYMGNMKRGTSRALAILALSLKKSFYATFCMIVLKAHLST